MSPKNWAKFIIVGLIWGSTFLWIKIAVQEVPPYTLVAYRSLITLLVLLAYILRKPRKLSWRAILPAAFLAVFNLLTPQTLIAWGELHIPSWLASILVSAVPFFTTLLAIPLFADERLSLRKGIGLALGFLGVIVLVAGQMNGNASIHRLGALAVLGAALSFSVSNVFTRAKAQQFPADELTFWMMIPAVLMIFPLAWAVEGPLVLPRLPLTWIALAWLGILNGGVAMILFFSLIQSEGPGKTSLVTYTYPLVGVCLGILFLQENPGITLWIGSALIVGGILVFNWKKRK